MGEAQEQSSGPALSQDGQHNSSPLWDGHSLPTKPVLITACPHTQGTTASPLGLTPFPATHSRQDPDTSSGQGCSISSL